MVKKVVVLLSLFLVLSVAFFFVRRHIGEFRKLLEISFIDFLFLSSLVVFSIFLHGLIVRECVSHFGIDLRLSEWFGLSAINAYANYLFFRSGMVANALYLKNRHKFPFATFISVACALYMVALISYGIVGLVASSVLYLKYSVFIPLILWVFGLLLFSGLIVLFFLPRKMEEPSEDSSVLQRVRYGWDAISGERKLIYKLMAINFVIIFSYALRLFYCYNRFFLELPYVKAVFLSIAGLLSVLFNITPAGLGVKEALIGLTAFLTGDQLKTGVAVAMLDRAVAMSWILLLGSIFSFRFTRYCARSSIG